MTGFRVPAARLRRHFTAALAGMALIAAALAAPAPAHADVLVFAAASQRDALDAVIAAYAKRPQVSGLGPVKASYQSSSTLARQIEQGAPADLYISANPKWMEYLSTRALIDSATRADLVGNGLVLVTAKTGEAPATVPETATPEIAKSFDLAGLIGDGRLAVGDPAHVPAGIYAKQALESLGLWASVEAKLARADNVRAALALVARGEAPYGIIYASDAVADKTVEVVARFPEDGHRPIRYPVALTAAARNVAGAKAFLAFLLGPEAATIYARFGFRPLKP